MTWLSSLADLHRSHNEGAEKSSPSAPGVLLNDLHFVLPSWTERMVGSKALVTSLVSILLLFRMLFSVVESLGLPSVCTKASGRDSRKSLRSVEVNCWLNVYLLVNANVSRVALEQECSTNRTLLNSVFQLHFLFLA